MNFLLKNKNKELIDESRSLENQYELSKEKINLQEKFIKEVINNKSSIIAESQKKISDNKTLILSKE